MCVIYNFCNYLYVITVVVNYVEDDMFDLCIILPQGPEGPAGLPGATGAAGDQVSYNNIAQCLIINAFYFITGSSRT